MKSRINIVLLSLLLFSCTFGQSEIENSKLSKVVDPLLSTGFVDLDSLEQLSNRVGEGAKWALASQSVVNLWSAPKYQSEVATQVLMGTPLIVLESEEVWSKVVTPEGYIAWALRLSITPLTQNQYSNWLQSPRVIVSAHYTLFRSAPSKEAKILADGVKGGIVTLLDKIDNWYRVQLPSGQEAFLPIEEGAHFDEWVENRELTVDSFISSAMEMLGAPYVWGGTSFKGVDCSGLTKTALFLNGAIILRNASQQVVAGDDVDSGSEFSNLRKGDLLFFGERVDGKEKIDHVVIYLGGGEILHSSHFVRVNSLFTERENYYERSDRFLRAKRLLPLNMSLKGVVLLKNHKWYFK